MNDTDGKQEGADFVPRMPTEDMSIKIGEVKMAISMNDFQSMRTAVANALRPEVPWMPTNMEEMRRQAELLSLAHLKALEALLNKYEYMEHEGFAGPDGVEEYKKKRDAIKEEVITFIEDYSGFNKVAVPGFLDAYGITNKDMPEFYVKLRDHFGITGAVNGLTVCETVGDVVEGIQSIKCE